MVEIVDKFHQSDELSVEATELKGFSRSIAELEWLLLTLVILYLVTPDAIVVDDWLIIKSSLLFGGFVLAFRFLNFYRHEARWKLIIEVSIMIIYITWVLWNTGKINSPLLNLYLLVIITSGMTLGKSTTLLFLAFITSAYIYMGFPIYAANTFSYQNFGLMMTVFTPYLLVAYITTMLSADLHYAKKMFKILSETDDMTGLANLRSFKKTLAFEIKKTDRYKHVISILMIDADGLKVVNDSFGHDAGNEMIKTVAKSIETCLRETDKLARYGGDEFIILLPETNCMAALEVAERIRKAVENTAINMEGNQIKTTVSIGVASYPEYASDLDELLRKVDRALYQSKESGRNTVSVCAADKDEVIS